MISQPTSNPQLAQAAESVIGKLAPAEIVDREAYDEYLRLDAMPIMNDKKYVLLSNGRKISLGTADFRLKHIIKDLPDDEQQTVFSKRKIFNNILCKRNAKLQKAYGTIIDSKGRRIPTASKFAPVSKEMVELFGRMFSAKEVHEITVKQFNIPCSLQSIINFRDAHINEINERTEVHKRTYSDIRLGHKRSRLEELTWIYGTRRRIYEGTKKGDDHRLLLMTLEQVRKEIEGDSLRIDGTLNMNVEATIQGHINRELFSNFVLKEMIMARVAARLKVNVEYILTELNKSYYHGILNPVDENPVEMPAYPSNQTYDFDRIRRINIQANQIKQLEASKVSVTSDVNKAQAGSIKEMLLAKLANKSENVNYAKNKMSGKFTDKANETNYSKE